MSCYICVDNGLGDKLLDVIGFYIICKYLNYNPHIILNKYVNNYAWGHNKYDPRLFKFTDIIITEQECENYINSPNPSSSLCPYKVYTFINKYKMVSFEQISNDYNIYAKTIIQPSEIINSKIPIDIEKAYGIHLRKTDKVKPSTDSRFENSMNEASMSSDLAAWEPLMFPLIHKIYPNSLVEQINYWVKNPTGKTVEIIELFYNGL